MKIDESNYDVFKKVQDITGTDYEILWTDHENIQGYIFMDSMFSMIEDLLMEIDRLNETLEDTIKDRDENYKPIPFDPYKEYGISEDNFH